MPCVTRAASSNLRSDILCDWIWAARETEPESSQQPGTIEGAAPGIVYRVGAFDGYVQAQS